MGDLNGARCCVVCRRDGLAAIAFFLLSFSLSFLVLIHGQFVTDIWTFATDTRYGHFLFSRLLSFFSGDAADSGRSSF